MTTMVCFRAADGSYCVPVQVTHAVYRASRLTHLPDPRPDVAGIIAGDPPMPVISPLGDGGDFILVVEGAGITFGLLVDAVTGLRRVDDNLIYAGLAGQSRELISGTINSDGDLIMVADLGVMAGRL